MSQQDGICRVRIRGNVDVRSFLGVPVNVSVQTDGGSVTEKRQIGHRRYNDFDIILGPFLTHHESFTTLHAPRDVLYLVTMVIGC